MFDEIECSICHKKYNNSSGIIIQSNLLTGKMECMDCAFQRWENEQNTYDNREAERGENNDNVTSCE